MVSRGKIILDKSIDKELCKVRKFMFKNEFLFGLSRCSIYLFPVLFFFLFIDIAFEISLVLRLLLLFLFLILSSYFIYLYLLKPILKYLKIINGYDEISLARYLINDPQVEDKLLTYIELKNFNQAEVIINNAITQKENEIKKFSLEKFFTVKSNSVIIKFLSISFSFSILLFTVRDSVFQIAAIRLFNPTYSISYKILKFELKSQTLEIKQNEDIELKVLTRGSYIPQQVYLRIGEKDYFAQKINDSVWVYTLHKVNQITRLYFHDLLNQSSIFTVVVLDLPVLRKINIEIFPPSYTGINPFIIKDVGNFSFPKGSKILWTLDAGNTDKLFFYLLKDTLFTNRNGNSFDASYTSHNSFEYEIALFSGKIWNTDKFVFQASVIPDEYPNIIVKIDDSQDVPASIIVDGQIVDDYGFTGLHVVLASEDTLIRIPIPYSKGIINQRFYYQLNLFELCKQFFITKLDYYFEVADNDSVSNFKTSRSQNFQFEIPDASKVNQKVNQITEGLKEKMTLGLELMKKLNVLQHDLQRRFKTEGLNQWEKSQLHDQLSQSKSEMKKLLDEMKVLNEKLKSISNLQKGNAENKKLFEKQMQIQELMEKLMDNELNEMFKEFEKLKSELKEKEKNNNNEQLSFKFLEEMLNRNLEMLKRYEIEKGINDIAEKLDKLSEELSNTENTDNQEKIEENVRKDFEKHKELLKKNEDLQKPFELNEFNKEKNEIQLSFEKNNGKELSKTENKNNSEKLKSLSNEIKKNMDSNLEGQMAEDIDNLKQIRSNLLLVSYTQEELIDSLKSHSNKQPSFNRLLLRQKSIINYWYFIKDSINSLVTRNPMLGNMIAEDMTGVENMNQLISQTIIGDQYKPVTVQQSKSLSHYNNILLFIDEAIQRAEEDMNSSGQGGGCPKPGKGKPSPSDMAKTQQGLKSKLKDLLEKMKQKQGDGENGGESISEQLGNYLSQQEQMQKMIGELMNQSDMGQSAKELLREVNNLIDKNINDIVNKTVNNETISRQERIITRLLESDKAEQERKTEEKRESQENKREFISQPIEIKDDSLRINYFDETMKYRLLNLNKYYLDLYQNYLGNEK